MRSLILFYIGNLGSIPSPRSGSSLVVEPNNRYLLLFGGYSAPSMYLNDMYRYDTWNDTWIKVPVGPNGIKPRPVVSHAANVVGDYMYIFGGVYFKDTPTNQLAKYSFSTNEWEIL